MLGLSCGTWALQLWHVGSVAPWHVGSQFPDQGLNSCPLHWQADFQPLDHRGNSRKRDIALNFPDDCVPAPLAETFRSHHYLLKTYAFTAKSWSVMFRTGEGYGTPLQYSCLENPMDGGAWWAAVHRVAQSRTRLSNFTFTFHFHALDKEIATHSSVLAWRIPGMGKPGGLQSLGSHRVRHG